MGYNLLINGVVLGVITHLLTIDPNFLGHKRRAGEKWSQDVPRKTSNLGILRSVHFRIFLDLTLKVAYLEDHPRTCNWLITMVIVSPLRIGLFPL